MSNIIVHKDRWAPKPKFRKAKKGASIQYHIIKNKLLASGKTIEEINKYFKNKSKEDKSKRQRKILILINTYLPNINLYQRNNLIKTLNKDFKDTKLARVEEYLSKIAKEYNKI